jgi:hypothetical protein
MYNDLIKLRFPGFTTRSISELPSFDAVSKEHCNIGGQIKLSLLGLLPQLEVFDCRHVLAPSQGDHYVTKWLGMLVHRPWWSPCLRRPASFALHYHTVTPPRVYPYYSPSAPRAIGSSRSWYLRTTPLTHSACCSFPISTRHAIPRNIFLASTKSTGQKNGRVITRNTRGP